MTLAQKLGQEEPLAQAHYAVGGIAIVVGNTEKSRIHLREALTLYRKLGRQVNVGFAPCNPGALEWMTGDINIGKAMLEDAVKIGQELPELNLIYQAQSNLAGVMQDLGDLKAAQGLFHQVLEFQWKLKNTYSVCSVLSSIAYLVMQQGNSRRAIQLLGVVERFVPKQNIFAIFKPRHERFMAMTRTQLSESSFASYWQEGKQIELEDAVKYTLELTNGSFHLS